MFDDFLPQEWFSVQQLHSSDCRDIPNVKGVYFVLVGNNHPINFLESTTAITKYKGRNLLYDPIILENKFDHSDKQILYIGKAGGHKHTLKKRIKQLVKYGYGQVENHRGGRAMWQIQECFQLAVGFIEVDASEALEKELLSKYFEEYGVLPLANWKIG